MAYKYRVWKVFEYQGKEIFAYTLPDESPDEEEATIRLLAYERRCQLSSIHVHKEMRRTYCQE